MSRRMDRYFGRFRCRECGKTWESSHVYTRRGTLKVLWKQRCKACTGPDAWVFPHQLEMLDCSVCGEVPCVCVCDDCGLLKHRPVVLDDSLDDYEIEEEYCECSRRSRVGENIDESKPHRTDLCQKCVAGLLCVARRPNN